MRISYHDSAETAGKMMHWVPLIPAFMGLVFLIVAGGMYLAAGAADKDAALLAREGQEIEATVTDRRIVEKVEIIRDDDDRNGLRDRERVVTTYYLTVSFRPEGAEQVTVERSVPQSRYNATSGAEKITVFYAPSQPTLFEFQRGETAGNAKIFRWASLGLAVLGIGAMAAGFYLWRRRDRA
jgi:Protein of unknown function (DUF3592)